MQNLYTRAKAYFIKDDQFKQIESRIISGKFLIEFSFICIILLALFTLANIGAKFYEAALLDALGVVAYFASLFMYKKTKYYTIPCILLLLICQLIILFQQIIIPWEAFHNLLFFPALTVFSLALIDNVKIARAMVFFTIVMGIISYFVSKYGGFTIKELKSEEIDFYVAITMAASLFSTFKVVQIIYSQKIEAMERLNNRNSELQEVIERNKKLFMVVTHDLANPIMVITTHISLLQRKIDDQEFREKFFDRTKRAEADIFNIIKHSKEMVAIEDGKLKVDLEAVNLYEVVEDTIDSFNDRLEKKNMSVFVDEEMKGIKVIANAINLKTSVINNLMSNAIKFSKQNSKIDVTFEKSDHKLKMSFRDYGIGMSEELIHKIFLSNEATTREGVSGELGTGYGMPLAKAYVKAFGGELICHSKEGKGTEFILVLRLADDAN